MQAEAALEQELSEMAAAWADAAPSVSLMAACDVPLLEGLQQLQVTFTCVCASQVPAREGQRVA